MMKIMYPSNFTTCSLGCQVLYAIETVKDNISKLFVATSFIKVNVMRVVRYNGSYT